MEQEEREDVAGYYDPVTRTWLPYVKPIPVKGHFHEDGFDDRCGACRRQRERERER